MTTYHTIVSYALKKVGPMTVKELAEEIGMSQDTCREALRRSKEAGKVYVHDWQRGPRNSLVAVFAEGNFGDKEKPGGKDRTAKGNSHAVPDLPVHQVTLNACGLKRHPTVEDLANVVDMSNPFSTAMWNVTQGERG